jgi:hypothetical protein
MKFRELVREREADEVFGVHDPAKGVRYMAFSCTAAELRRRCDLRRRYPLIKMLWPLPYCTFDIPPSRTKVGKGFETPVLPERH